MNNDTFSIFGGDQRLVFLAMELLQQGFPVCAYGLSSNNALLEAKATAPAKFFIASSLEQCLSKGRFLIGPVPFCSSSEEIRHFAPDISLPVSAFLSSLRQGQQIFGGAIPETIQQFCSQNNIPCHDVMKLKTVSIENAIATAEGSIAEAIRMSTGCLHHAGCLVLGYGKCAQVLARKLEGLHANVTVCARNPVQRSSAFASGFSVLSFDELTQALPDFDFIFNTIPAPVLGDAQISLLKRHACIIDIASAPGGTDFALCKKHGISAGLFPGLPGKYAPKTSGKILADAILSIIHDSFDISLSS